MSENSIGFYRLGDVLKIYPVSRAEWYAGMKTGKYPESVKIGKRNVGWKKTEIHNLVEKAIKGELNV